MRISKILPILNDLVKNRERTSLPIKIENTWILLGGPACLEKASSLKDARAFFQLLADCEHESLIINTSELKKKIRSLYASPDTLIHPIKLLTIHAAKGLEFDHVFLPALDKTVRNDDQSILNLLELPIFDQDNHEKMIPLISPIDDFTLTTTIKSNSLYQFITRRKQEILTHELDRLFYVAKTRAKKSLYLSYGFKKNTNDDFIIKTGSFLKKLFPVIQETIDNAIASPWLSMTTVNHLPTNNVIHQTPSPHLIKRLPLSFNNPFPSLDLSSQQPHNGPDGFMRVDQNKRRMGILLHRILQQLTSTACNQWQSYIHARKFHCWIKSELERIGITTALVNFYQTSIIDMLSRIINDPQGQWILSPQRAAKSEFALSAILNKKVEHFIIDRTFIDDKGNRWIIDYKTSLSPDPTQYKDQLHKYRDAMQLFDETHPIRLALYFLAIPQWVEIT